MPALPGEIVFPAAREDGIRLGTARAASESFEPGWLKRFDDTKPRPPSVRIEWAHDALRSSPVSSCLRSL